MAQTLTPAHVEVLAQVELFERLDRVALARLAACADPLEFGPGETLFRQGDAADGLYVVVSGSFGIFATDPRTNTEAQIGEVGRGGVLGELALLFDEPRTATVRALLPGEILRIEQERFVQLLRSDPALGLAIAATLGRRLRERDRSRLEDRAFAAKVVAQALIGLPVDLLDRVLRASLLPRASQNVLSIIYGAETATLVNKALESVGFEHGRAPAPVQRELRSMLVRDVGDEHVAEIAETLATRLFEADLAEDALEITHAHGRRSAFLMLLSRALHSSLPSDRRDYWLEQVSAQEALASPDLALGRVAQYERRAATAPDSDAGKSTPRWRARIGVCIAAALVLVAVLGVPRGSVAAFGLLLGAAMVLWVLEIAPASTVGLGLMAAWVLGGIAQPLEAAAGFASPDWLFVLAVFGIAAAVARSGLLFRAGLRLVRRLPNGLFWQSGTLLLTGLLLTPLLPTATGRAAITGSLAASLAESLRMRDRQPAAAVLGLAAWLGSGPLLFTFLNGSSLCLLAWGLMPDASRARFGWVTWALAALPLTALAALGGLAMLFLVLRPRHTQPTSRGRVDVQLAVLGPPSVREWAMVGVLLLTVAGLIAAPALHMDVGVVAIIGLLGAVASGNFDRQSIRELDWDYLVFYGAALSLVRLGGTLGLDGLVGSAIGSRFAELGANSLMLVLAIAAVTIVVRLALAPDQAVLLLCLALIPSATALGLDPWIIVITILASTGLWLVPSQMPSYLAAYSASEGRLFSPSDAQRAAFGYAVVLLGALTVCAPYWRLPGLV